MRAGDARRTGHRFMSARLAAREFWHPTGRLEHLRLLLGHADFSTTLRYGRLAAVDVAEAHSTADPARSLKVRV